MHDFNVVPHRRPGDTRRDKADRGRVAVVAGKIVEHQLLPGHTRRPTTIGHAASPDTGSISRPRLRLKD